MKNLTFFLVGLLFSGYVFAQKNAIDEQAFHWQRLDNQVTLSADGKWAAFAIANLPPGFNTLKVQCLIGQWNLQIVNGQNPVFSPFAKMFLYQKADTIGILNLDNHSITNITGIENFRLTSFNREDFLLLKERTGSVQIINLKSLRIVSKFFNATITAIDSKKGKIILQSNDEQGARVEMLTLSTGKITLLWKSDHKDDEVVSVVENNTMSLLALDINNSKQRSRQIILVDCLKASSKIIYSRNSMLSDSMSLSGIECFTKSDRYLFLRMTPRDNLDTVRKTATNVSIWSYRDSILYPNQFLAETKENGILAVLEIGTSNLRNLKSHGVISELSSNSPDYVVCSPGSNNPYWWPATNFPTYLLSLRNGKKTLLGYGYRRFDNLRFSPSGSLLLFFDRKSKSVHMLNVDSGINQNLTNGNDDFLILPSKNLLLPTTSYELIEWNEVNKYLVINGNFDAWRIGYRQHLSIKNLTRSGMTNKAIKINLMKPLDKSGSWLAWAFDQKTKRNGFYSIDIKGRKPPELLVMSDSLFYRKPNYYYSFDEGMKPLKASDGSNWIVKCQSATLPPNYYYTTDFRKFHAITNIKRDERFKWLTSSLVDFKMLNGQVSQGVLYKPEGFDSLKQYPVIINYYEQLSHRLNEFPYPEWTNSNINIPWFLSRDYIVFTPDIFYKPANTSDTTVGEWAYNSILAAYHYLSKMPYVDSTKIGIQGHSFGGLETAFIATHSKVFAAAMEAAGSTDPVSRYLTLVPFESKTEHYSVLENMEISHESYGATIWERPDLYLRNSSVLNADKTTTPILIMHNPSDNQVQWRQGIEFYMSLRRLRKKVWMLQYENSSHSANRNDEKDLTIRMTQFFDHYLKGAPAPVWMTKGIPAKLKGIEDGYALDPGVEP